MRKPLTDIYLRSIPAPPEGRTEIADLRCQGLAFRITSGRVASWSFRFRDPRSGKTTRFRIGGYPDISLADARQRADELRKQVAVGVNPVASKRQERQDAETKTFNALADLYLDRHARPHKRPSSVVADERNLKLHVRPKWGKRRYDEITRRDVIELVEGLVTAGRQTLANRVQSLISKIYSFALDRGMVTTHPCVRLKRQGKETVGRRVLSDDEIRLFWARIIEKPVSRPVGLALRLALLTGTRAGEVAGMTRSELHKLDDLKAAHWILPRERSKNKREHLVPLSNLSRETIAEALSLATDDQHLFARPRRGRYKSRKRDEQHPQNPSAPIHGHALAVAMARFAAKLTGTEQAVKTWRADPPTPHDLRRTVATRLAELGVPREDRDAIMNHTPQGVGKKHYEVYERRPEKQRTLDKWSAALAGILGNEPDDSNVVPIKSKPRPALEAERRGA
jgi:integrase